MSGNNKHKESILSITYYLSWLGEPTLRELGQLERTKTVKEEPAEDK
jgi:hypothetical protein